MKVLGTREIRKNIEEKDLSPLLKNRLDLLVGKKRVDRGESFGGWEKEAIVGWLGVVDNTIKELMPSDLPESQEPGRIILVPGKILSYPSGTRIWRGETSEFLSDISCKEHLDRPVYMIEGGKALGIIQIREEKEVGDKYKCRVDLVSKFSPPKEIEEPEEKHWVDGVTFKQTELDWQDPKEWNDETIKEKHKLLHNYFESIPKGYHKEDIISYHKVLVKEMNKRTLGHIYTDDLDKTLEKSLSAEVVQKSPACRMEGETEDECVSRKVPEIIEHDESLSPGSEDDRKQAVAIAHSMCSETCNSGKSVAKSDVVADEGVAWIRTAYYFVRTQERLGTWEKFSEEEKRERVFESMKAFQGIYPLEMEYIESAIDWLEWQSTEIKVLMVEYLDNKV